MCDSNWKGYLVLAFVIIILAVIVTGGIYFHYKLKIDNFQATITELTDEEKCVHICGFQYSGMNYFDQYKFCLEKCDRISERVHSTC